VAWGGDGTVNGAASALAGTGIPFAIVPGGSGNGLARDLLLPFDPSQALTIAATGGVRTIDAGDLHGSLFFNVAGIGLDARIAGRLATEGHRRGLLGYVLATVAELRSYEPCAYSIRNVFDADGRALTGDIVEQRAMFIALANSRQYGSGAQIAPKALLDDGLMEVVVVEPLSGLQIAQKLPAFFGGTLQEGAGIIMRSAASMDISSASPIPFHVDGEPRMGPERISLRTRRGVLSVKVTR
jgi:diacylglycerol kinase family enzyme